MSALLALLLIQAAPPVDPATAIGCGATALGDPAKLDFESWERALVFAMNAANGDGEGFRERFQVATRSVVAAANEGKGLPLDTCRKAFPAVWTKDPVKLPAAAFERALFCTSVTSGLHTATREMRQLHGIGSGEERLSVLMYRFAAQIDKLAPPTLKPWTQAQMMAETSRQLMAASRLGMLSSAVASCEAAFPPG